MSRAPRHCASPWWTHGSVEAWARRSSHRTALQGAKARRGWRKREGRSIGSSPRMGTGDLMAGWGRKQWGKTTERGARCAAHWSEGTRKWLWEWVLGQRGVPFYRSLVVGFNSAGLKEREGIWRAPTWWGNGEGIRWGADLMREGAWVVQWLGYSCAWEDGWLWHVVAGRWRRLEIARRERRHSGPPVGRVSCTGRAASWASAEKNKDKMESGRLGQNGGWDRIKKWNKWAAEIDFRIDSRIWFQNQEI
jgi:hypothetical protein